MFSHPPDAHGIKAACGVEPLRDNVLELFKQIETARDKARADNRTWRVASMTELVEPVTGSMTVQKALTHSIRRKSRSVS